MPSTADQIAAQYGGVKAKNDDIASQYGGVPSVGGTDDEYQGGEGDKSQQKGTPLEEAISPTGSEDNFLTSPHGFIRSGARQIVHGIGEVMHPGQRMQGASDVIRGAGSVLTPAAIPLAVANPVTSAIGIGAGLGAGTIAHAGLGAMGASEGAQNLGEDVAGLGAGALAGGLAHPRLSPAVGTGLKVAAPKLAGGGAMIAAGEGLAKVPGMEWPARIGLGYPGARQIGHGLQEGFEAGKANFKASRPVTPPQGPVKPPPIGDIPPEGLAPGPVGPLGKPTLPSGRRVGAMPPETPPVASPPGAGTQGPAGVPNAPSTPIEAANKDTHPPGVTQADEFKGSVVPGPVQAPVGQTPPQAQPVANTRTNSPSEIQHQAYTDQKHENIGNFVKDPKNGITPEFLNKLRDDITQVDDPAKQANAVEIAKGLGKAVHLHAKELGNESSKYGTFNLQDFNVALKHLKALQPQK